MSKVEGETTEEAQIPVYLYGRISDANDDDGDETSLPNQRDMMEEFAQEQNLRVEGWFYDRNVSGATDPFERDGFMELVSHLRETEVSTILIKNGKRIARGESASDIKKELKGLLNRDIEIIKTHPGELEKLEKDVPDYLRPTVEGTRKTHERLAIEEARQHGKLVYRRKKNAGELCSRPPRGTTTDEEGGLMPVEEFYDDDGNRVEHKEFDTCVEILNHWPGDDDGPYTSRSSEDGPTGGPSGYSVGKEYGIPNPARKVKNMWENRAVYRELAEIHRADLDVDF